MHRWIVPSALLAIALLAAGGCSSSSDAGTGPAQAVSAASEAGEKVVPYRNAEGKLLCPVMNVVIASEAKAKGFQDYEGVRYYFCCGICPGKFAADPAKYAKK